MTARSKKATVVSLVTVGFLSFIIKLLLFFYLMEYAPTRPNMVSGEIYSLNNHGYIFYVIKIQSILQDALFYAFFIFAFGAAILEQRWKTIRNLFDEMPKKPNY